MSKNSSKLWFRAKTYGWGWYPCSWQGWVLIALYIIQITSISLVVEELFQSTKGIVIFFLIVITSITNLLFISYKAGEKPRWRWGKDT